MKRIYVMMPLLLFFYTGWSQINEKDTTATTLTTKLGSIELTADVMPDHINLQWSKGPHDNTGYFELYRSADGVAYNLVKQFQPSSFDASQRSFEYRDEEPLTGRNFYRLVGYDRHTSEKTSVDLVTDYKNLPRKIQPTLMSRGNQLYIQHYDGQEMRLWIFNASGTPVVQNRVVNGTVVNVPELVANGLYIYQLMDKHKMVVANGKIVIQ